MFSFHKPKVYRSPTGCCICKAKSSSSRFTDSRKYEDDFVECFQLSQPRRGEICNACVLLVKRFKRLPPGLPKHWGHVVDARVGPGLKSMTKFKKKKEEKESAAAGGPPPEKFLKIMKKKSKKLREQSLVARENSPVLSEEGLEGSIPGSPMSSHSDPEDVFNAALNISRYASAVHRQQARKLARKSQNPCKRKASITDTNGFLQAGYWKFMKTCCGAAFRGQDNEIAIDLTRYKPCSTHSKITQVSKKPRLSMPLPPIVTSWPPVVVAPQTTTTAEPSEIKETKVFSDNSSDSGYDDCSNIDKPHGSASTNPKSAAELSIISDPEVSKKLDMEKSVNLLNLEKGVVLVGGSIKNNLGGFKKNFVSLNRSMKPNTIKVNTNLIKSSNNIVIIKPKSVTGTSCIVKSQGPVSNINQVQQAAN